MNSMDSQVSAPQGFSGRVLAAGLGNAANGRKMCLRGGGPVMGVEVKTTRPGNGKDFPKKVRSAVSLTLCLL